MAQKVQTILIDDLDGGEGDETVSFSLDGVAYEIDLSAANAEQMRDALALYVGSARRAGSRSGGGRGRRSTASAGSSARATTASGPGREVAQIRDWARENGYTVNDRGRIPRAVREAYEAAHN